MFNQESQEAIKKFVAVMAPPNLLDQMTAEERCQRLIKLANLKGYDCEDSYGMAVYWWGNQAYFDHKFAKAIWESVEGEVVPRWQQRLINLALIDGMFERLNFIEKSLGM